MVDLIGGELALCGLGRVRMERWGKALLVVHDPCPLPGSLDHFLRGLFQRIVEVAAEREVGCTIVQRHENIARLLIANSSAIRRAQVMLADGMGFVDVVARLQEMSP